MIRGLIRRVIEAVLPTRCGICQAVGAGVVCPACLAKLEPVGVSFCRRCGRKRQTSWAGPDCGECHGENIGVVAARSCLVYHEAGRQMLAEFKYNQRIGIGDELVKVMQSWLAPGLPKLFSQPDLRLDAVVPVPLHKSRLRRRKFNQAEMIAARVSARLGLHCWSRMLRRTRDTSPQFGLSPVQRRANVKGAFAVPTGMNERLKGKDVLLVDDLMTTGATLGACARALRRGGAGAVYGLTLFSTVHDVEPAAV